MDHPEGTVVLLGGSAGSPHALIDVDPAVACPRCAAGKGCGAGMLAVVGRGTRRVEASVPDGMVLAVGDRVAVSLLPENLLTAAAIAYGLPLAGAVLGASTALYAAANDLMAAGAASIGLAAGILAARLRLRQGACLHRFVPVVHARVPAAVTGRR
jgi:sigma-E factor negative regulatory protein RseC